MAINNDTLSLDHETVSFVIVRFFGIHSAQFNIYPVNVSPVQLVMAGESVQRLGYSGMDEKNVKQWMREVLEESKPKILVAE